MRQKSGLCPHVYRHLLLASTREWATREWVPFTQNTLVLQAVGFRRFLEGYHQLKNMAIATHSNEWSFLKSPTYTSPTTEYGTQPLINVLIDYVIVYEINTAPRGRKKASDAAWQDRLAGERGEEERKYEMTGWAVDWWSLGIVIYKMLLGYHPMTWYGES